MARDDELRRRRRRRCTDVGDEIGDGHVALVTDRRDDRHRRSRDHPRDDFLVERPEVFDRPAAAADDDHVDAWHASNRAQRLRDVDCRAFALNPGRADHEVRVGVPAPEHLDDVADRGAVQRRHDPDLARQRRQRSLARRVEQPFLLQAFLELIECELERTEAVRLEVLADQLIFAFRLVHRDLAARDHTQPVHGLELQIPQRRLKHEPAELRGRVFEREVQVAGIPDPAVRQLAFHPDFEEFAFEHVAQADRELGDRQRAARGWGGLGGRRRLVRSGGPVLVVVFLERQIEQVRHGLPVASHARRIGDAACELGDLIGAARDALDIDRASRLFVGVDNHGIQPRITGGGFEPCGQRRQESAECRVDVDADNRIVWTGHPDVGEIRGALGQNPLVSGLHVRVGADDRGHPAVQVPPHCDFFGRRLGVKVHEDNPGPLAQRFNVAKRHSKRVVDADHEHPAHQVDDAHADPALRVRHVRAAARHAGGIVGRPDQPGLGADIVERLLLVPHVVAVITSTPQSIS